MHLTGVQVGFLDIDTTCFKTTFDESADETTCGGTNASDGSNCVWCSTPADGDEAVGVCVSNGEASLVDGQFGLSCPSVEYSPEQMKLRLNHELSFGGDEDTITDLTCLKAAWVADDAEAACGGTTSSDGGACVWCSIPEDNVGVCLSEEQGSVADGKLGLTC